MCSWCVSLRPRRHSILTCEQGIEGSHVVYHPDYSPEDDDSLQGVQFVVSSSLGGKISTGN